MPNPSELREQELRDYGATDYCNKLAAKIKYRYDILLCGTEQDAKRKAEKAIERQAFNDSWKHAFHFPVDGLEVKDGKNVAELIYS